MRLLCDSNVFVALAVEQHVHHERAAAWFSSLSADSNICFCRATQLSFLRLLTIKIAPDYHPLTNAEAATCYERLLADPLVEIAPEPESLDILWPHLATRDTASPKLWMDAYLAAFAITGGFRLVTLDRDFQQFAPHGLDLLLLQS